MFKTTINRYPIYLFGLLIIFFAVIYSPFVPGKQKVLYSNLIDFQDLRNVDRVLTEPGLDDQQLV